MARSAGVTFPWRLASYSRFRPDRLSNLRLFAAGRRRWRLRFAALPTRPAPRSNRDVVLHVVDARYRPRNLARVSLDALVGHAAGQYRPAALATYFDIVGSRQQIERVGDKVLDFLVVGRSQRLTTPHGDRSNEHLRRDPAGANPEPRERGHAAPDGTRPERRYRRTKG